MNHDASRGRESFTWAILNDPKVRAIADAMLRVADHEHVMDHDRLDALGDVLRTQLHVALKPHLKPHNSRSRHGPHRN